MINGSIFRSMFISAANNIANLQEDINKLNVFPVPDGDTGTNMSLTMQAGKHVMEGFQGNISECSDKIAAALLRGGRGNSGVILSLFFRGLSKELKGLPEAECRHFAKAFRSGVDAAYKAVRHPTEGTVLTVMRECADKAEMLCNADVSDSEFFNSLYVQAKETLAETPDILPVLKQAGVVDAGGSGFCAILQGMVSVIDGNGVITASAEENQSSAQADFARFNTEDIKFAYCTECIVNKDLTKKISEKQIDAFREYIMNSGDSGVFIDDEEFIKFHIHTNDPGKILTKCLSFGVLAKVKVENMKEQHTSLAEGAATQNDEPEIKIAPAEKKYGFVSIAAGKGIMSVFEDLGTDVIVSGGQTMNPSTEDIIEAIYATPSEIVFVLPNNKNIYLSAKQAEEIVTEKKVIVLHTVSIPQGISAMLAFNPDTDEKTNYDIMREAKNSVTSASMTFAARDSHYEDFDIKEGQKLGLVNGKVKYIADRDEDCIARICEDIKTCNFITLFYGDNVTEDDANKLAQIIKDNTTPDVDIVVVNGGQPVYYYIISAE